jgi:predicted ABC-type ATPase
MPVKRLRIFAGPNGSGKSTFIHQYFPLNPGVKLGVYINADDIEKILGDEYRLNLQDFEIDLTTQDVQSYFIKSEFAPIKSGMPNLWEFFTVEGGILNVKKTLQIDSYIAADLAELFRQSLMKAGISFSFETVMSDYKKIELLKFAKESGYKIYLYYFATEDPIFNISRVDVRVALNGHAVDHTRIIKRYYKSLHNLKEAIKLSGRAYIFDNTDVTKLFAEITDGTQGHFIDPSFVPNWFITHVIDKKD